MNFSRGLFRLWLVASLLWLGYVVYASPLVEKTREYTHASYLRTDVKADELTVSPVIGGVAKIEFQGRSFEVETGGVTSADEEAWLGFLDASARRLNQNAAVSNSRIRYTLSEIQYIVALSFGAPLAALLLGFSLRWVVRGFSR